MFLSGDSNFHSVKVNRKGVKRFRRTWYLLALALGSQVAGRLIFRPGLAFTKMSTNFVGKWDRFTADIVIADKFGRIVQLDKADQNVYPKTTRLQMARRVSNTATIRRYLGFKTEAVFGLRMSNIIF
jgi:hypothetical protein